MRGKDVGTERGRGVLKTLFTVFLEIGVCSYGGGYAVIPLIQSQVVEERHWLTVREFTDIITISQMTPGPLAVNTSTFVGLQTGGIPGAVLATAGCILAGVIISLLLYRFLEKNRQSVYIREAFRGLRASSLGLILSAAVTILGLALFQKGKPGGGLPSMLLFAGSLLLLRRFRIHPILLMLGAGAAGLLFF
nr:MULTISPECIES: chromate transporter [Lactonifactor]